MWLTYSLGSSSPFLESLHNISEMNCITSGGLMHHIHQTMSVDSNITRKQTVLHLKYQNVVLRVMSMKAHKSEGAQVPRVTNPKVYNFADS